MHTEEKTWNTTQLKTTCTQIRCYPLTLSVRRRVTGNFRGVTGDLGREPSNFGRVTGNF